MRALTRRGHIGVAVFFVFACAVIIAAGTGADFLAWCLAPCAGGPSAFVLRTIVELDRARAQAQREAEMRGQVAARRERLRRGLHTPRAPQAADGQCPVCGYDDLDALAADDAFLEESGSRFARVASYGARRAHQECAELVPYTKSPTELALEAHGSDHHGAPWAWKPGCPLCAQEARERLAEDPELGEPLWPPLGLTVAGLNECLAAAFAVPPSDLAGPAPPVEPTERELRAMASGLVSPDELRRILGRPTYPHEKGDPR